MIDIEYLRQWIGREDITEEVVTSGLVQRFNATFDREGALAKGNVAPTLIHICVAPLVAPTSQLGSDGHPARGSFLPPVPLERRMWAGGSMTFHDDIRIGDLVSRRSTIRDVAMKEGGSGVLCFVTVDHEITSGGRKVITERQDIVYRNADVSGPFARKSLPPAPSGASVVGVKPTPPLLFRYSALTFNGHRIHYDTPYAKGEEGYPGLVVHGPLQATMLVHFAEKLRGARPAHFDFRSMSPLYDTADFTLNADEEGEDLRLWTSRTDGPVAMEARAKW